MVGHGVCRIDLHLGRGQRGKRRQRQCGQHRTGSRRASGKCFQFHNFPLLIVVYLVAKRSGACAPHKPEIRLAGNCETVFS